MTRAVLVTGGGGVGKTTIAAALAVRSARAGVRTLVVTVDPALIEQQMGQVRAQMATDSAFAEGEHAEQSSAKP